MTDPTKPSGWAIDAARRRLRADADGDEGADINDIATAIDAGAHRQPEDSPHAL